MERTSTINGKQLLPLLSERFCDSLSAASSPAAGDALTSHTVSSLFGSSAMHKPYRINKTWLCHFKFNKKKYVSL